jgi:hypothetical protein
MPLRFAANLSMLWAGLPLPEQFERAARAGFGAVELWWPGDADAALLPGLMRLLPAGSCPRPARALPAARARRSPGGTH